MNSTLRSILPLATGTFIGALGAVLLQRSLPPQVGSPEEKIAVLQNDLKKAQQQLSTFSDVSPRKRFGATTSENIRSVAQAIKDGKAVTPDDIFRSFKPLLRDLSPLTERMKSIEIKRSAEARAGEYARKYGLTEQQQNLLVENLVTHNTEQMKQVQETMHSDHATMRDYMKAQRDMNTDMGLDETMGKFLSGEKRQEFLAERLNEKAQRVQHEADGRVKRIDNIVKLDDQQRHQLFFNLAQTSPHYDSQMSFEGLEDGVKPLAQGTTQEQAMFSVLRPEQRQAYETHRENRRQASREEAAAIGVTLPDNWDMDDDLDF
jgi:hypothetical protein